MCKRFLAISSILVATLAFPLTALAAEFHSGEKVTLNQEQNLNNAYVAGQTITVESNVDNDLVAAGQTLTINSDIENNLIAAGNEITVAGTVGGNARIAGKEVTVDGTVEQDLVVFAAKLTLTKTAAVNGDLVFNGGELLVDGPVTGTIYTNSTKATINSTVGSVEGWFINDLTLGSSAEITRDLNYTSPRQAEFAKGAVVHGAIDYEESDGQQITSGINNTLFYYGLLASAIFCLTILLLIRKVIDITVGNVQQNVLLSLGIGIASFIFLPVLGGLFTFLSVWLGVSLLLFFALLMVLCFGFAQILIGWAALTWWFGRSKQPYTLDWRAAIFGVLLSTLLVYVPVLGWFILFMAFLLSLGGLTQSLAKLR